MISRLGTVPISNHEQEAMAAALITSLSDRARSWKAEIEAPKAQLRSAIAWVDSVYPIKIAEAAASRLKERIVEYRLACEQRLQAELPQAATQAEVAQTLAVVSPMPDGLRLHTTYSATVDVPPSETLARIEALAAARQDAELLEILRTALDSRYVIADQAAIDYAARQSGRHPFSVRGATLQAHQGVARKGSR